MNTKSTDENTFLKEREKFNENASKLQDDSNKVNLRKVEHPEPFDFFGNDNHN